MGRALLFIGQVEDCNGELGGDGVLDECGVCDNDPGNDGFLDECGTCDSDPTNDCEQDCEGTWGGDVTDCGNTTVWLSCDENFEEIRWGLFDEDFMFVTDGQGAASEADEYIALDFDLAPGTYNFGIFDAGDNGGCEVEVRVFGDFAAGESTDGYTGRSLLEFVVPEPPLGTIVDLVVESPQFSTLEAAVVAAGLADDLSAEGPFTVFAPTDDAFAALPEGTLDTLLADPTGDLANILLHHVHSGNVDAEAVLAGLADSDSLAVPTLLGTELTITNGPDGLMIDNAMITVTDIFADNGVIHQIDAVLLPPEPEPECVDLVVETPLPDDADTQDVTLRLDCWDAETGSPATGAYTDQYNNYEWQEFSVIAMEEIDLAQDPDYEWADYKLVATMGDDSRRIIFFTDPAAESGQLRMLGFNNDFSQFYFDTGIRTWGDSSSDEGGE